MNDQLWGVAEHVRRSGDVAFLEEVRASLEATVSYLLEFWEQPNFDCWEEYGDRVHPSTLAAIYGGLGAVAEWVQDERVAGVQEQIRERVAVEGVVNGRFGKSFGDAQVDACGDLPEQVPEGLLHPAAYAEWVQRWGEAAKPLLWSHAMYIVLKKSLVE